MVNYSYGDIEKIFSQTNVFLTKAFPNGVSYKQIQEIENTAFKNFVKILVKNIDQGKIRYNSDCKKARQKWFLLETIEKIMEMDNLEHIDNLGIYLKSSDKIKKYQKYLSEKEYDSYSPDYGEERF